MRSIALALVLIAGARGRGWSDPMVYAGSDPGGCEALRTINATSNKIWVTVYDLAKTRQLDYGWVDPCTVRVWRAGSYSCGSYYHVRAEVKPYDVSQPNVFDTNVETNPQGGDYGSWVVTLRRTSGTDKYYWEHGNTAACTPTGVTACCKTWDRVQGGPPLVTPDPLPPKTVDVTFDNATKTYAQVLVYLPGYKAPRTGSVLDGVDDTQADNLKSECVPPQTKKTWNLYGAFEYRYRVTPHLKSCDGEQKLQTYGAKTKIKGAQTAIRLERDDEHRSVKLVDITK